MRDQQFQSSFSDFVNLLTNGGNGHDGFICDRRVIKTYKTVLDVYKRQALGGFLSVFLAGMLVLLVYFMIFFPLESQGKFPWSQTAQLGEILLRCGLVAGILSTGGGIFAGLTGSVYLAFGFPFVLYYFCVIVRDRYFEKALWPVSYTHLDVYKRQQDRWEAKKV